MADGIGWIRSHSLTTAILKRKYATKGSQLFVKKSPDVHFKLSLSLSVFAPSVVVKANY